MLLQLHRNYYIYMRWKDMVLPVAWISLGLLFIYFTKSAQIPFCSRLINATAAPTPIPALLHSSTTVIAGVYLGLILDGLTLLFIDSYEVFFVIMLLYPIYSLLWSLFRAISLSDTKPIIANPTISQISHIFLALLIFPSFSLFHIIVHALFKPMLFLLAGSPIHITSNFQSIYRIKLNNALISIVYILGVLILIFNYSKEGIIHSSNIEYASSFVCIIGLIGAVFTSMHSLKIYIALIIGFYSNASGFPILSSSFVLPVLTLSEILIDQYLDICFTSTSLYYSLD